MSSHGPVILKPIGEVARYQRNIIPANIPEDYTLKPRFDKVANEGDIRKGVIALRDFLLLLCDRLTSDGHLYAKPPKKPSSMGDYPFLYNMANLLVDMGYHGTLSESGESLLLTKLPLCTATVDDYGKKKSAKITGANLIECLRFLSLCGCAFSGVDLEAKTLDILKAEAIEMSYPKNPIMLTGLKAMSIADMELRKGRRHWNDNYFLRCNYRLLKAEESDLRDVLSDFLHPLPKSIQEFALNLHQRYTEMGLTCMTREALVSFGYVNMSRVKSTMHERDVYAKRVWEFSYALKDGYCIYVRPQKTNKYADVIKTFHASLQGKIARGYCCDRKRGEPCQHGCQGISIPMDDSILGIEKDIEIWLDYEVSFRM